MIYSQENCQEAEIGMVYQFSDDQEFGDLEIYVGQLERVLPHSHYAFFVEETSEHRQHAALQWAYCRAVPKELLGA